MSRHPSLPVGSRPREVDHDQPLETDPDHMTDGDDDIVEEVAPKTPALQMDWDDGGRPAAGKSGIELVQALVKRLPNAPGVYRMMDAAGNVLYVGKARSLKKRVTN